MLATPKLLLSGIHSLPTLPKVVQSLIETFESNRVDVPRIARLVGTDPVITAKVLRLANSAYYRRTRSIASVNDAVVYLGLDALRMLVIGVGFTSAVKVPESLGRTRYWRYCLHTAVAVKFFAAYCEEDQQTAFTAGLLHAIGEPLLVGSMREASLRAVDKQALFFDHGRAQCERDELGFSFADVGAELADSWCFPTTIVEAIRTAPEPLATGDFSRLGACVYLGAHFAAAHERGETAAEAAVSLDTRVLERVGIELARVLSLPPVTELARGLEELTA